MELKHLYVDFHVPQIPIGHRVRLGGVPINVTPLHSFPLYTMDAGGGDLRLTWTPRLGYASYGDAVSANNRKAQDAWTFSNRLIYIF